MGFIGLRSSLLHSPGLQGVPKSKSKSKKYLSRRHRGFIGFVLTRYNSSFSIISTTKTSSFPITTQIAKTIDVLEPRLQRVQQFRVLRPGHVGDRCFGLMT